MQPSFLTPAQQRDAHGRREIERQDPLAQISKEFVDMETNTSAVEAEERGIDIKVVNRTGQFIRPVVMTVMDGERRITQVEVRDGMDDLPRIPLPQRQYFRVKTDDYQAFEYIGRAVNSLFEMECSARAVLDQMDEISASICCQEEERLARALAGIWDATVQRPADRMTPDLAWAIQLWPRIYTSEEQFEIFERVLPAPPDGRSRLTELAWILFDLAKDDAGWDVETLSGWLAEGEQSAILTLMCLAPVLDKLFDVRFENDRAGAEGFRSRMSAAAGELAEFQQDNGRVDVATGNQPLEEVRDLIKDAVVPSVENENGGVKDD